MNYANRIAGVNQNGQAAPLLEFKRQHLRDFMAGDYRLEYLIDGVLVAGQPGVIAGAKKTLKTSIMLDMAVSLATVTPFLGRFRVLQSAKVGIMSGESGPATIKETLGRIYAAKELDPGAYEYPRVSIEVPVLTNAAHLEALERFIEEEELEVLFLDPTYLCMPLGADASNLFAVGALLSRVGEIGQRYGCAIMLCHHNKRTVGKSVEPPELDDIAWAGFPEWARQWLLLGRMEPFNPECAGEHRLWLSVGGSARHHGLWALDVREGRRTDPGGGCWDVRVCAPGQARQATREAREEQKQADKGRQKQRELQRNMDAMMRLLAEDAAGETVNRLRLKAGVTSDAARQALTVLEDQGRVQECEIKKHTRKEPGYRLCNPHEACSTC